MTSRSPSLAALFAAACVAGFAPAAFPIDHANLDDGRPLRVEDAYPIAHGEIAFDGGVGFRAERHAPDRGVLDLELVYGALPNLHVELGTELSTSPHSIEEPTRSGDLELAALYNFNQETLGLPAFAAKVGLVFPTGVDSAGVDAALTAIATKSIGRLSGHLNASYRFVTGARDPERGGIYELILGAAYPLGAPKSTRLTLMADVFARQSALRGEPTIFGAELGARHQLTQRWVLDFGVGSELAGPSARSIFYATTGLSFGF